MIEDLTLLAISIIIITIIDFVMYIPMIAELIKFPEETSKNINLATWMWWSLSSGFFVSYFYFEVGDTIATLASLMHLIGCSLTVMAVLYFRKKYH